MRIDFIKTGKGKEPNDLLCFTELEVVPRKGETISFPKDEGGKNYLVNDVDYMITDKKEVRISVWVS